MDEYFTELMIEALNRRLSEKHRIDSLEEIMREKGIKVGQVDQKIAEIKAQEERDEEGINSAIQDSKHSDSVDDINIRTCWDEIVSEYDSRTQVKVTDALDVYGLEHFLSDKNVSFIVHSKTYIFNGKSADAWKAKGVVEGYDLSLYLKNLGIKKVKIDDILNYIGQHNVEAEKEEQKTEITETYVVKRTNGIHCRPASELVEILDDYTGTIHMKSEITEKDYEGHSIMAIVLLGAGFGQELKFTYDVSTPELMKQYQKVSPVVREVVEADVE